MKWQGGVDSNAQGEGVQFSRRWKYAHRIGKRQGTAVGLLSEQLGMRNKAIYVTRITENDGWIVLLEVAQGGEKEFGAKIKYNMGCNRKYQYPDI